MKKLNRILSLSAAAALALSLSACGAQGEPVESGTAAPAAGETYKVAVIKQMDHASLDCPAPIVRPGHCRRCGRHYPHRHHRRPGGRRLR